ncbi:MAG: AtpZ/AtpI family protein [Candidatus Veblenbacteria bacterium]|nr:AtpZ/AtpI family protein [Candidatus Veblenbacteria bacterium]MDZ4229680.1 AtpZ/AtpI family protein [Candidatus Veblenbacteria bacterium]
MSNPEQSNEEQNQSTVFKALGLAWELGYTIAVPLVVLALAGRLVDRWLGTSPWFLLVGVLLSIVISTWTVYRKTKLIISAPAAGSGANTAEQKKTVL